MQFAFAAILALLLAVAQPVLSTAVLTAPVAATTGHGGKSLKLKWSDNGKSPKLNSSAWGGINIFLAAGGESTQYKLQQLATNISVSKTSGSYIVDASIGPSGQYYFIRMEGTKTNSSGIPAMAFSARFTLEGMTGTFNSTELAAAEGKEGSASSSSSSSTKTSTASTSGSTGSVASTGTSSASSASTTKTSSAGKVQQALILVGSAAAAAAGFVVLV